MCGKQNFWRKKTGFPHHLPRRVIHVPHECALWGGALPWGLPKYPYFYFLNTIGPTL
jgi:hypothetical protein